MGPGSDKTSGSDAALSARIADARLRLVYRRLPLSVALSIVVSLAFGMLMAPFFPTRLLVLGLALIHLVGIGRFLLAQRYRKVDPSPADNAFWENAFVVGSIVGGASWAFGAVVLMPGAGKSETVLLLVMILSVSAVAVSTLAPLYRALLGFLVAAMLPPIVTLFIDRGPVEAIAGASMMTALLCLVAVGRQSSEATTRLMRTEIELSESMRQTAAARAAAEASSRAKSRFLANMSHEVRTPLNGILGTVEVLGASPLDDHQRRWVALLRQSAEHLLHIVNEILDLSKIEAGRIELAERPFDVPALVEETAAMIRPSAERAGLRFDVEIAPDVPQYASADPLRLRQVLLNLLSNAVKFTEHGVVALRAWRDSSADAEERTTLCFEVADSGIGIAAEDAARIFDPFTQADDSSTRRFGGTGLGLTVCRRLAESMGGGIALDSRPGEGSRFRFTIRAALVAACASADGEAPATLDNRASASSGRVLLAEDNPVNGEVAVAMLERLGMDVVLAVDGDDAVAKSGTRAFDLVLMDCQMPRMDGYAATRELRRRDVRNRDGARLPIIALTASAFPEDRRLASEAGMDDFVTKPVSMAAFDSVLKRWLAVHRTAA